MGIKDRTTLDVEVRTAKLEAKEKELIANGVRFVQMEFIDINGRVRGKLSPVQQAVSPGGFGVSSFIQAILSGDNVCLSPYGNFDNGIPKLSVIPDPDTFRQWTWKPDTASVLCELREENGDPARIDPRKMLKAAEEDFLSLGIEVKAALEYEFFLFHNNDEAIRDGRYNDLIPFGRSASVYNLATYPSFTGFAENLFDRSAALDLNIEAFHTEYGEGMYEYVHGVSSALAAADSAARGKLHIKQLAQMHGLVATYMPAIGRLESDTASGAHHNISLWARWA
jgi:glutamine synthetase